MLRVATEVRGEQTASSLIHYHCTMVRGNGGDWMQSQGEKQNPYWGSKMLRCGNLVSDLSVVALEKAFGKSGANP
jgi:Cu(I)/Ag(I) efflux system membrane fusion protein